jgi:hypothetical protein
MSLARARQRMSGLGLGIENDEEATPAEGGDIPVVNPEAEETVDSEVMEVTEAEGEVKEQEEAVDQLEEAAATLESIYQSVQASLENGGLSAESAVYLNHAVSATLRSVGVDRQVLPSLESFGGATGKLQATKVSLEGIGDWLKTLWQAIKNAVLKAIAWVKDLFAKIFGGLDKIEDRAKKLKEEANKMKSEKPKDKITFRSVSKLHTTGKANAGDFQNGLDILANYIDDLGNVIPDLVAKNSKLRAESMAKLQSSKSAEEANLVYQALSGVTKSEDDVIIKAVKDKAVLSGGVSIKTSVPDSDQGGAEMSLVPAQKWGQIAEDAEMEPLDKPAVIKMLDTVEKLGKSIKARKEAIKKAEDATEAAVKNYEKVVEVLDKDKGSIKSFIDESKTKLALRSIRRRHLSFLGSLTSHAFTASRAALVLCEKSIAAYGVGDKKDEKK